MMKRPLSADMEDRGQVEVRPDGTTMFREDVLFRTPSGAACAVMGRSWGGWGAWVSEDGRPLEEWRHKAPVHQGTPPPPPALPTPDAPRPDTLVRVFLRGKGVSAEGMWSSDGFLVLAGSQGVIHDNGPSHRAIEAVRIRQMEAKGQVEVRPDGTTLFREDVLFGYPSAAASAIRCARSNGWDHWRDEDGRPLQAWRNTVSR